MLTRPHVSLRPLVAAILLPFAACATSGDLPLARSPQLADSVAALQHDQVNIAAPLTVSEISLLAVQNDPDLRAVRARHHNGVERRHQ
jgi:hypothetical protein